MHGALVSPVPRGSIVLESLERDLRSLLISQSGTSASPDRRDRGAGDPVPRSERRAPGGARLVAVADTSDIEEGRESIAADVQSGPPAGPETLERLFAPAKAAADLSARILPARNFPGAELLAGSRGSPQFRESQLRRYEASPPTCGRGLGWPETRDPQRRALRLRPLATLFSTSKQAALIRVLLRKQMACQRTLCM